jgi:membrane-associated protease RseP (regulator of RpoE activity)
MKISGESKMGIFDDEELGAEDLALHTKLAGLRRVDAPADFDFRLKARIANGRGQLKRGFITARTAAYVLPAVAAAVIGGSYLIPGNPEAPIAAENNMVSQIRPPVENREPVERAALTPQAEVTPVSTISSLEPKRPVNAVARQVPVQRDETEKGRPAGSFDSAIQSSNPILPRGFDPAPASPRAVEPPGPQRHVEVSQILKVLGIDAVSQSSGWRVRGVGQNSIAERSGLLAGDLITALDEKSVADRSVFENGFEVKRLTVSRQGRVLQIDLRAQ